MWAMIREYHCDTVRAINDIVVYARTLQHTLLQD